MSIKKYVSMALAAGVVLFAASRAEARTIQIALSEDGGPAFTVVASGANFTAASFTGNFGDFSVTLFGGSSDNSASLSDLLSSTTSIKNLNLVSAGTHTLHLWVTQTDYSLPAGDKLNVEAGLGGSMTETTTVGMAGIFQAWGDNSNTAFGQPASTTGLINASQNGTTFQTGSKFFVFNRTNPLFSITSVANFTVSAGGNANYSDHVNLTAVPEPASMVLLGSGLLGLAMSARRRRKQ